MKRYNAYDGYECELGGYVEYQDAARILAQRDRLAELLRDARKYVVYETFAHDESPADKVLERIESMLAELDKEKQS